MQRGKYIFIPILVVVSIVGACALYAHFTNERIFRESAQHLEEIYAQVDRTLLSLTEDTWNHLDTWNTVIDELAENAPEGEAERSIDAFIEGEQAKCGFTSFFFMNGERFVALDGTDGTFETAGQLDALTQNGNRVAVDTEPYESSAPTLFAIPVSEKSYRGFAYNAIAVSYDAGDLTAALDIGTFDGTSTSTLVYPNGRTVFSTSRAPEYQTNLITYLGEHAQSLEGATQTSLQDAIAQGETKTVCYTLSGKRYYLVCRPAGIQDWMIVGTVPADKVNANVGTIQVTTMAIVTFVLVVFGCFIIAALADANRRRLDAKYADHLRQALDLAQSANMAKSRFLANMSHDIRTPINAIIGMARIAQENPDDPRKTADCLQTIEASSKHLLSLINDVLDVSKIESREINLQETNCCIDDTVENVLAIIGPEAEEKGLSLTVCTRDIVHRRFAADELRGRQIMLNLLSNAVKYTPRGGSIDFTVREVPAANPHFARLQIVVADTGIGMTEEFIEQLFQPFSRDERVISQNITGTGLGMTITKAIVDAMGGTIEVESEVGRGTTFTVELELPKEDPPLPVGGNAASNKGEGATGTSAWGNAPGRTATGTNEPANSTGPASAASPAGSAGAASAAGSAGPGVASELARAFAKKRFLIAEDSIINQRILSEFIKARGGCAEVASNGQEAVRAFSENPPGTFDAVFMDVMMPVMDGYAATRAIRELPREDARSVIILAVTANAYAEDVKAALDAGMNAHVAKPYNIDDIARTLLSLHGSAPSQEPPDKGKAPIK